MPKIKYTPSKGLVQSIGTGEVAFQGALLKVTDVATDAWGAIKPAMVPGLHKNLKVFVLDAHTGMHEAIFADSDTNTHIIEVDTATGAQMLAKANDVDFTDGCVTLGTGGVAGNQTCVNFAPAVFRCAAGKQWWAETAFKIDDHDAAEFFFGVTEQKPETAGFHKVPAAAEKDRVGFLKESHSADALTFCVSHNAAGELTGSLPTPVAYDTDADVLSLGIHWDGTGINFYSNIVGTGVVPGDLILNKKAYNTVVPSDPNMRLALLLETGTASPITGSINYIRAAFEV